MGPRRIAIIASWYPGPGRPIDGIFVRDQAVVLAGSMDVVVVSPVLSSWRTVLQRVRTGRWHEDQLPNDPVPTSRPRVFLVPKLPAFNRWMYANVVSRALQRLERKHGERDLIYAHVVLPAGEAAAAIGKSRRLPVVLAEHSGPLSMHFQSDRSREAAIRTFRSVSRVVAVGPALADEISELAEVPVGVVGNVIAPEFLREPAHPTRPVIAPRLLAIGVLNRQKRFDLLIRALSAVQDALPAAELVILGDGEDRGSLESLVDSLGLSSRVRFAGLADREAVLTWLGWCDVLVSTSDHESFGLAIAEALATGRPVVVTASGGPETFVDEAVGLIVPRGDVARLAAALRQVPVFLASFDPTVARDRMSARYGASGFLERLVSIFREAMFEFSLHH
jgi:teichuronic acid biosynthesis glycosyltransferase TuaC